MDDQAMIKTYGNTNLPEGTPDRPLVTFALFAYNQEKYIREAVEGAFAQTYSPLEIILSDDASTDRTFEIIEKMAQGYEGKHLIRIRRNLENRGILKHVTSVMRDAFGKYVVVAAGDDVSLADRVDVLTNMMQEGFWAVSGSYIEITDESEPMKVVKHTNSDFERCMYGVKYIDIHGATACYRREVTEFLIDPDYEIFLEDFSISLVLASRNLPAAACEIPLVRHRIHEGNIGIKSTFLEKERYHIIEEKIERKFGQLAGALNYVFQNISQNENCSLNIKEIKDHRDELQLKSGWISGGFRRRFQILLLSFRRGGRKWALLRVFGLRSYILAIRVKYVVLSFFDSERRLELRKRF